jgi:hypothetical protein
MGVPCMPVRTKCVVLGRELHDALGTLLPASVPFTPSKISLWLSASATYYGFGDKPVAKVMICGEPAVNKGADTTFCRPHVSVIGMVPPNVQVNPIADLGFFVLVILAGGTKTVWGPRSVQADSKSVAVIAIPYSPFCPFNQMICSDPCDMPIGVSLQMPSSVFAGMTLGDYALCVVNIAADMLLSFILNMIFGGMDFLGDFIGKKLTAKLSKILGPKLLKVLDFLAARFEKLTDWLINKLGAKIGRRLGKTIEEGLKKIGEWLIGNLSPGGLLGFGDGPPDPAPGATP